MSGANCGWAAARIDPDVAEFTVGRAFGATRWLIRATCWCKHSPSFLCLPETKYRTGWVSHDAERAHAHDLGHVFHEFSSERFGLVCGRSNIVDQDIGDPHRGHPRAGPFQHSAAGTFA